MFDRDAFITDCQAARAETEPRRAIREVLARACAQPEEVAAAFEPNKAGVDLLYHGPDLSVIHVVWPPHMKIFPHDHRMWAAIGIYTGTEDNTFYRRSGADHRSLAQSGGKRLDAGDVLVLGKDAIHEVANPRPGLTAAIHVYGGDFINQTRSQWGPGPRVEQPYDPNDVERAFEEAERTWNDTNS